MANVKRYKIEWMDIFEVIIDIDHAILTDEDIQEINKFWTSAKYREESKGGLVHGVLCMLGAEITREQFKHEWLIEDLIKRFDWEAGEGIEGWPPMDGSHGITIVDVSEIECSWHEMDAMEIPHPESQLVKTEQ